MYGFASPAYASDASTSASIFQRIHLSAEKEFANFGAYLLKVLTVIDSRWAVGKSRAPGYTVRVKVVLKSDGDLQVIEVESAPKPAAALVDECKRAVAQAAPFSAWTEEMKRHLGSKQQLTLEFVYDAK